MRLTAVEQKLETRVKQAWPFLFFMRDDSAKARIAVWEKNPFVNLSDDRLRSLPKRILRADDLAFMVMKIDRPLSADIYEYLARDEYGKRTFDEFTDALDAEWQKDRNERDLAFKEKVSYASKVVGEMLTNERIVDGLRHDDEGNIILDSAELKQFGREA